MITKDKRKKLTDVMYLTRNGWSFKGEKWVDSKTQRRYTERTALTIQLLRDDGKWCEGAFGPSMPDA